ncbi:hypothetical protein GLOIN_2v1771600 [Rhizophagus clarus]|uniref:Reverse transcriptase domain-containing protein n=1 Tax=Rhizophagus clarus TaxID=94130 RepID=A0A8H3KXR8_9GLOM|nr:hypothetical protein GLOIN_2v1771600 [Rhizophagus clarus]
MENDHNIVTIELYLPDIFLVAFKYTQPTTPHNNNFHDLSIKIEDITAEHWSQFEAYILESETHFELLVSLFNSTLLLLKLNPFAYLILEEKEDATSQIKKKDKSFDLKRLDRHTAIILDYADNQTLQFNSSFLLKSLEWIQNLRRIAQKRRKLEQKEYNSHHTITVTAAIEVCFAIIQSNQTRWISSVLDRHHSNVTIDRLMVTSEDGLQELLLYSDEVKQAAINASQLADILQDHNILCKANYCGLKGKSTASPIRLINNVIEDAKENSKELWIVLQDISKVFDSISLDFLELALKQIGLPPHAVRYIINLFRGRRVQVATIFRPLSIFQAEDAYMDDTAWIDYTKNQIQHTLDLARSFYELVDIKINHKKCKLIVVNPSLPKPLLSVSLGTYGRDVIHLIKTEAHYLVKHVLDVQRPFSTSALYHEGIIGLYCLWMAVFTAGIMNLVTILNAHNDATSSTLIRLRQAQLLMKLPHSCFSIHPHLRSLYTATCHSNLALFYLLLASDFYINLKMDHLDTSSFTISNVEHPLLDI